MPSCTADYCSLRWVQTFFSASFASTILACVKFFFCSSSLACARDFFAPVLWRVPRIINSSFCVRFCVFARTPTPRIIVV